MLDTFRMVIIFKNNKKQHTCVVFCYNNSMYYVYLLKCKDGTYTGCTSNLKERLKRHENGYVIATKDRRPVELENYFAFRDKYRAFEFEKYLKSGSGRAFLKKHFL